jgi:hypothetical protein
LQQQGQPAYTLPPPLQSLRQRTNHILHDRAQVLRPRRRDTAKQTPETHVRRVDGRFFVVEEYVEEPAAESAAQEGCHDGDLQDLRVSDPRPFNGNGAGEVYTYPEIIIFSAPYAASVSQRCGHETGPKVTSWVDSEAGFPAKASRDTDEDEAENQRRKILRAASTFRVAEGKDAEHQDRAGQKLAEKGAGSCHERSWVCCEDARARCRACRVGVGDGANAMAFIGIDGGFEVAIHDTRCAKSTESLGKSVSGELRPREAAVDAHAECDGWVQVAAGARGCVRSEHYSYTIEQLVLSSSYLQSNH